MWVISYLVGKNFYSYRSIKIYLEIPRVLVFSTIDLNKINQGCAYSYNTSRKHQSSVLQAISSLRVVKI